MRLFVALTPPDAVLDDLAEHVAPRRAAVPTLRWSDPQQWHITLAFLGEVPDRVLDPLTEGLQRCANRLEPVPLALAGAGAFPDPAFAKVLWVGVRGEEGLARWVGSVRPTCNHAGAPPDGQPFRAHVTLARSGRAFEATRLMRALDGFESAAWQASSFDLVASYLGQGRGRRPRYEVLERFPVGRAGTGAATEQA